MAKRQGQGGGPKTEAGKQTSSQNSTQHGCTARRLRLVKGEDPAEYHAHVERWVKEYPDERVSNMALRDEVVRAHWLLQRIERRYDELEVKLGKTSMLDWTEAEHQQMQLVLRYRTTAERTFYRAMGTLEGMRRSREFEKVALEKHALLKGRKTEGKKSEEKKSEDEKPEEKKPKRKFDLRQHITISKDGEGVKTHFTMSNDVVREQMEAEPPEATHVMRIIYPWDRELKGYEWLTDIFKDKWPENPMCYQRMTYAKWKEVTEREEATLGAGHIGPTNEAEDEDWSG
jgi:hypothetical protein